MREKKEFSPVVALTRGLEIMRCFGASAEYRSNAELASQTGVPRPTVSRLTATLTELGYLQYRPDLERYRLGPKVLDLGYRYLASEGVREVARPFMQELADATNCFIAVGVAEQLQMTYTQVCHGPGPLVLRMETGSRVPMAYTSMGRAWLAALEPADRTAYYDRIRAEHAQEWPQLEKALEDARADYERYGFVKVEAQWSRDISGVGVPLALENGQRLVAFKCSGPSMRLTDQVLQNNLGPRLRNMVDQVRALVT